MVAATAGPPALDPSDPYAREAQTFAQLSEEMIARVASYGREETLATGVFIFERGQRGVDFFVILDGTLEVFELDTCGTSHLLRTLRARQFTGELTQLDERPVLVSARAAVETRVIRVAHRDLRRLMESEPDIGEIIMRAFILRRVGFIEHAHGGVAVVGSGGSSDTLRIQRFLRRNGYPYRLLDTETDPAAARFLGYFALSPEELPVVAMPEGLVLRNPGNAELATALGLVEELDPAVIYDVAVIGAGPAGLATAVYAASEGLSTIVLESTAPGGQAGTSSRIENYLGFPNGITGQALAGRAQNQAQRFGARLAIARTARALQCAASPYRVRLESGEEVRARAVVVATGARYRKLDLENFAKYEGQGIHYAATPMEAKLCANQEVIVVGGGNSAGQAAMFLCRTARHVHILVRGSGLVATMSDYLVQRIARASSISVHPYCEVTALAGERSLGSVSWTDRRTEAIETRPVANLFLMIGAQPNTDWLDGCLALDAHGFVCTGRDPAGRALTSPFATTAPGVFAVGDVRSGSVKRVASAVGEGSVVVQAIHQFLSPAVA